MEDPKMNYSEKRSKRTTMTCLQINYIADSKKSKNKSHGRSKVNGEIIKFRKNPNQTNKKNLLVSFLSKKTTTRHFAAVLVGSQPNRAHTQREPRRCCTRSCNYISKII